MYIVSNLLKTKLGVAWLNNNHQKLCEQAEFVKDFDFEKLDHFRDVWFEQQKACVFLDAAEKCVVYERRPIICKSYFVLNGPESCKGPLKTRVAILNQRPAMITATEVAVEVSRELKISPAPLPLPIAVLLAVKAYQEGVGELRKFMRGGR
jgi:Fe-S-cluster containining protein